MHADEPKKPGGRWFRQQEASRWRRALSRGQWEVQRERFQIDASAQPATFADAEPIGGALRRILAGLGAPDALSTCQIHAEWPRVVGDAVARHTRPGGLQHGTLTIYVDTPVWLSELSRTHRGAILAGLARLSVPVRALAFRIDPGTPSGGIQ